MRSTVSSVLLVAVCASPAWADVVVLKDGERVEGIVEERGAEVVVRLDFGSITFERSEIARVEKGQTALGDFEQRRAALAPRDAEGRYRLGLEAEKQGLDALARALYREVLELSADHKGARAALGYRRHEGAWLTEDEYMLGQGYVRQGGAWITREAAAALVQAEEVRRAREAEQQARLASEARIQRLEAEVAAARQEAATASARAAEREVPLVSAWVPYWTGERWAHKPSAGVRVTLGGAAGGVNVQLGAGATGGAARPASSAAPRARVSRDVR
jgi:hypothetical protein